MVDPVQNFNVLLPRNRGVIYAPPTCNPARRSPMYILNRSRPECGAGASSCLPRNTWKTMCNARLAGRGYAADCGTVE